MFSWTHLLTFEALALLVVIGCTSTVPRAPEHPVVRPHQPAAAFLHGLIRPWPNANAELALAASTETGEHVSIYDNALLVLYLMRSGEREQASRILGALAALQLPDGALPFSFAWPRPDGSGVYVRNGATAWVGYAAAEYLDADSGGPRRDVVIRMAHGIANYLLQQQVTLPGDTRHGLLLGGTGSYRLELDGTQVREVYVPGEMSWASTEHNIDAYFFLRDFGQMTGDNRFKHAADQIRRALAERGWLASAGQLARGFEARSLDQGYALDCASWGALFLRAIGDATRAETSLATADLRYRSSEPITGALGHRPYAHAVILANPALREHYREQLAAENWDELKAVWSEGSAGVALAALRLGHRQLASSILEQLEKLRAPGGGLPYFTIEVPFEMDDAPSIAGTAWVELVRYELARPDGEETLWRKR